MADQLIDTVQCADALDYLRSLPSNYVNCIVTSPPYFGLRSYMDGDAREIGKEQTPAAYVEALRVLFAEARRVLRDDGVLWLNLGDTYASKWAVSRRNIVGAGSLDNGSRAHRPNRLVDGLKEKDLIGIPWRVAFALQDDGWILRSDVIWAKKNPMPESVTDRPTKAHEYVFLFAKSPRYWYDAEAIREPAIKGSANAGPRNYVAGSIGNQRKFLSQTEQSVEDGRNARTVWTIPTRGNSLAHFAMMPPELARRCIVSGCPKGGIVFDPFMGGGTTAIEARKAGRHYIGSELNPEYAAMARNRLALGDETTKAIDRGEPTTLPLPFEGM